MDGDRHYRRVGEMDPIQVVDIYYTGYRRVYSTDPSASSYSIYFPQKVVLMPLLHRKYVSLFFLICKSYLHRMYRYIGHHVKYQMEKCIIFKVKLLYRLQNNYKPIIGVTSSLFLGGHRSITLLKIIHTYCISF